MSSDACRPANVIAQYLFSDAAHARVDFTKLTN